MTGSGVAAKFLDAREIEQAIAEVRQLASDQDIEIALAGGAAMQLYGSDRMTKDVDFIADAIPAGIKREKRLSFGGIVGRTPSNLPVDFIVRNDDFRSVYEEGLAKARAISRGVRVVRPEHLAAMKLIAGRDKDESDLRALINSGHLDLTKARKIIRKHLGAYAVKDFNAHVLDAEWRKRKGI